MIKTAGLDKLLNFNPLKMRMGNAAIVCCDGGCNPNPGGPMGGGVYLNFGNNCSLEFSLYLGEDGSNNKAEMLSAMFALEYALEHGITNITLYLDSKYALYAFDGTLEKWKKNSWIASSGKEIANVELWKEFDELLSRVNLANVNVKAKWVKGHQDYTSEVSEDDVKVYGNIVADKAATQGMKKKWFKGVAINVDVEHTYTVTEDMVESYKEVPIEPPVMEVADKLPKPKPKPLHPLLAGRHLYFKTNTPHYDDKYGYCYFTATYSKPKDNGVLWDKFGTEEPDNLNSCMLTAAPMSVLETLIKKSDEVASNYYTNPICLMLDKIRKPAILRDLEFNPEETIDVLHKNLMYRDGTQLTWFIDPPLLAYRGMARMQFLYDTLVKYMDCHLPDKMTPKLDGVEYPNYVDITDVLYTKGKKKIVLSKEAIKSKKVLKIKVLHNGKTLIVPITFGIDLPGRPQLGTIVKTAKAVRVVLVKFAITPTSFKYATIFVVDDDIAIFGTSHSIAVCL